MVQDFLLQFLAEGWEILVEAVPYLVLGFFMAGLLKAYIPDDWVAKHLGKSGFWNVIKASLIGIPIPLCSCGVVPTAAGIRRQGASKGATASFLVSTPETGVDSIAITYGLLGPVMMVIRPVSALITAITAGLSVNLFDKSNDLPKLEETQSCCSSSKDSQGASCCDSSGSAPIELTMVDELDLNSDCCGKQHTEADDTQVEHVHGGAGCECAAPTSTSIKELTI